jgi:hypothetical protein
MALASHGRGLFTTRDGAPRVAAEPVTRGEDEIRKFEGVGLGAVLAVSAALSACGRGDDWQASAGPARVCVDGQGRRQPDQYCQTHAGGSGLAWYYISRSLARSSGVPGIGAVVGGGSYAPASGVSYGAAPTGGIARGGFGATGEGAGGHGGGE